MCTGLPRDFRDPRVREKMWHPVSGPSRNILGPGNELQEVTSSRIHEDP